MKEPSNQKKLFRHTSRFSKIIQWNWNAIRAIALRIVLTVSILAYLGTVIFALLPMLKGYYVDGVTKFGGNVQPDKTQMTIVYNFNPPRTDETMSMNYSLAYRDVVEIYAPINFPSNIDKFCFGQFGQIWEKDLTDLQYGPVHPGGSSSSRSSFNAESRYGTGGFLKDECLDSTNTHGQRIDYANQSDEITLSGNSKFYFPYDSLAYEGVILVSGIDTSNGVGAKNIFLVPKIAGKISAPNWDVKANVTENYNGDYFGSRIRIEYTRPLLYRLLVPLLLLLMLGVIIALPFISETSTFLETLIGVIFGLWGLHAVLIPSDVTWPTFIDSLILSLYALLGFSAVLRVAIIPIWKKLGK